MALSKSRYLAFGVAFALSGCSFASDALFPSLTGADSAERVEIAPSAQEMQAAPPTLGSTSFEPGAVTPGQPTGTFVGQKVSTFRGELSQLQNALRQRNAGLQAIRHQTVTNSQRYHETVATINARLQVGTTPGNPDLQHRWEGAQTQLDALNTDIAQMNQLATQVASDSAMAAYLLDSIRAAYGLSGAVEEDHRQLRILEDEANQTTVLIERLLSELSQDIARQQTYVANERSNLNALALGIKSGQLYGASLGSQAALRAAAMAPPAAAPTTGLAGQRPLVVIRFDRPNVTYEQALYQAVSRALERRPDAVFDLVAVAATTGNVGQQALNSTTARRNADQVMRSLTQMGLPGDRIRMAGTTSQSATANEVHLYVR